MPRRPTLRSRRGFSFFAHSPIICPSNRSKPTFFPKEYPVRICIRRVEGNLSRSMIESSTSKNVAVQELPIGLRELCLRALADLPGIKSLLIYERPEQTLLDRASGHATLSEITDHAFRERVAGLADLFVWYFTPHWTPKSHEEDELFCIHCRVGSTDNPESFCPNPHCICHTLWQAIMGPGYQKPTGSKHPAKTP